MSKIYDSLDYPSQEIRVIDLLPGLRNGPIECMLQSQDLNDPSMEFEALSYEWGEPDPAHSKHSILLDGKPFSVRENLWEALHHIRDPNKQRRLWIDAICINQDDLEERSHQVGLMGDIYRTATSVNVWLRHEVTSSRRLFRFPYLMQKSISHFLKKRSMNFNEALNRKDLLCALFKAKAIRFPFLALLDLLKRRYWTRIWIVQEFILARNLTIYCGWDSIGCETFLACLIWISGYAEKEGGYIPPIIPIGLPWGLQLGEKEDGCFLSLKCRSPPESVQEIQDSIGMKISMVRVAAKEAALWELMEACLSSTSSDPRDRIYALLALAYDVPKEGFKVDYSRSIFKVKMDFLWSYQCKKNSRPEFISKLCQLVDRMLGDCDSTEEDLPQPERLIQTQREEVSREMRVRLLTHKKRRLDLLKEQKMDEMRWRKQG